MPVINVMFWNIQDYGSLGTYRTSTPALNGLVAEVAVLAQADVIFVQELKNQAILNGRLTALLQALRALPAPFNNWYMDWIKGAVRAGAAAPYATSADLDWSANHYEGYAMFWNQNLAKFMMTPAGLVPVQNNGMVANTQSEIVKTCGVNLGNPVVGNVPAGGITVPAGQQAYVLPAGTTAQQAVIFNNVTYLQAGIPLGADVFAPPGLPLPANTRIGGAGLSLNTMVQGVRPVVVPGGYLLTDACTLPPNNAIVVPQHALGLVLWGRQTGDQGPSGYLGDIGAVNFRPGQPYAWQYLYFPSGAGNAATMTGGRRPCFATIDVNVPGAPASSRLIPLVAYHAPAAAPASSSGMQRAAFSQQCYQVFRWTDGQTGQWIDADRLVLGGDFNVINGGVNYPYEAFTNAFGFAPLEGGADCQIRANSQPNPGQQVANRSTIQINDLLTHQPYYSNQLNDYRRLAIDNVFYRGFPGAQAQLPALDALYNLLGAVTGGLTVGNIPPPIIQAFTGVQIFHDWIDYFLGRIANEPELPQINVPMNSIVNIEGGLFAAQPQGNADDSTARRAAEFVHLCVSDHLPALFTMNL